MTADTWLAILPVLVPLTTAMLAVLLHRKPHLQQRISLLGVALFLLVAWLLLERVMAQEVVSTTFGNWPVPFGIEFRIDRLGASLVVITALMGLACLVFQLSDADPAPAHQPMMLPLVHGLLAGVAGSFSTGDLFNLYVWFEIMLICSVGLLAIGGRRDQLDGTLKYLSLSIVGTMLLLIAVGSIYAATGHLNLQALGPAMAALPPALFTTLLATLLVAFLIKAGAFPMFAWLPASYHTLPAPVLALFAGLLTKVGVYTILRAAGDVFAPAPAVLTEALGWIAAATMLTGVIGAAYHWDMRRILAFHIISQIGYILLGIALASEAGNAATLFYTLHHIIVKANLFLIAAIIFRLTGSYDLRQIGGLYALRPALAVLFLIPALSLVGIPPLSGFWSKLFVLQEAIAQGRVVWTILALSVSVLTLYSMMKIWMEAFWKSHPDPQWQLPATARLAPAWMATVGLATITVLIGLNPQPLAGFAAAAARSLGL